MKLLNKDKKEWNKEKDGNIPTYIEADNENIYDFDEYTEDDLGEN